MDEYIYLRARMLEGIFLSLPIELREELARYLSDSRVHIVNTLYCDTIRPLPHVTMVVKSGDTSNTLCLECQGVSKAKLALFRQNIITNTPRCIDLNDELMIYYTGDRVSFITRLIHMELPVCEKIFECLDLLAEGTL